MERPPLGGADPPVPSLSATLAPFPRRAALRGRAMCRMLIPPWLTLLGAPGLNRMSKGSDLRQASFRSISTVRSRNTSSLTAAVTHMCWRACLTCESAHAAASVCLSDTRS